VKGEPVVRRREMAGPKCCPWKGGGVIPHPTKKREKSGPITPPEGGQRKGGNRERPGPQEREKERVIWGGAVFNQLGASHMKDKPSWEGGESLVVGGRPDSGWGK